MGYLTHLVLVVAIGIGESRLNNTVLFGRRRQCLGDAHGRSGNHYGNAIGRNFSVLSLFLRDFVSK